ncbi:MAG TPA: hypothetical protein VGR56_06085, partial [Nitrososphaerales archaeon]|nr:hypothetical protein [Nitrososphaerales archaeon]
PNGLWSSTGDTVPPQTSHLLATVKSIQTVSSVDLRKAESRYRGEIQPILQHRSCSRCEVECGGVGFEPYMLGRALGTDREQVRIRQELSQKGDPQGPELWAKADSRRVWSWQRKKAGAKVVGS